MKKYLAILVCAAVTTLPGFEFAQASAPANKVHSGVSNVKVINVDQEVKDILAEMKQQLSASTTEIVKLKDSNLTLKKGMSKKEEELARLKALNQDYSTMSVSLKPKLDALDQQLLQANKQIESLKAENDKYKESLQYLSKVESIASANAMVISQLKNENSALSQNYAVASQELSSLKSNFAKLQANYETAMRQDPLTVNYKKQVDELSEKLAINESTSASYAILISQLKNENSGLSNSLAGVNQELAGLKNSFATLQSNYQTAKQQETLASNYKRQLDELVEKLAASENTAASNATLISQLKNQNEVIKQNFSGVLQELSGLKKAYSVLQNSYQAAKQTEIVAASYKRQIDDLNIKLVNANKGEAFKSKINQLNQQLLQANMQTSAIKAENAKYKVSLQSLANKEHIVSANAILISQLKSENSALNQNYAALKQELANHKNDYANLLNNYNAAKQHETLAQNYKKQVDSLAEKLANVESIAAANASLIPQLKSENSAINESYASVKQELTSLKNDYVALQTNYQAAKQNEIVAANYKKQADILAEKLADKENTVTSNALLISQLKNENSALSQNYAGVKQELAGLKNNYAILQTSYKEAKQQEILVGNYKRQIADLTEKLKAYGNTDASNAIFISQLKNENSALSQNYAGVKQELAKLKNENLVLSQNYAGAKEELLSLKNNYSNLQNSYQSAKQQETIASNYKKQVNDLSEKLINVNSELDKSKQSKTIALRQNSTNQDLNNKIASLQVQNEALKSKLDKETEANLSVIVKVADYMKAANVEPAVFFYNMGKAYQDSQNFDKAVSNYKRAISANPGFGKAYCDMGLAYAEMGDLENAKANLTTYLGYTSNPQERTVIQNFITKLGRVSSQG